MIANSPTIPRRPDLKVDVTPLKTELTPTAKPHRFSSRAPPVRPPHRLRHVANLNLPAWSAANANSACAPPWRRTQTRGVTPQDSANVVPAGHSLPERRRGRPPSKARALRLSRVTSLGRNKNGRRGSRRARPSCGHAEFRVRGDHAGEVEVGDIGAGV